MSDERVPVRYRALMGEEIIGWATIGHGAMRDSVTIEITNPHVQKLFQFGDGLSLSISEPEVGE